MNHIAVRFNSVFSFQHWSRPKTGISIDIANADLVSELHQRSRRYPIYFRDIVSINVSRGRRQQPRENIIKRCRFDTHAITFCSYSRRRNL